MASTLYFAYGSNLDKGQMKERCPSCRALAVGRLNDHSLAFSRFSKTRGCGVADVVADEEGEVWGLLYELTKNDLTGSLDHYEGYPQNYTRLKQPIETLSHGIQDAWVYTVVDKKEFVPPDSRYLSIIKKAAGALGFPREYCSYLESFQTVE